MSNTVLRINDVAIELVSCSHCGASPTEAEAQAAIQAYLARMGELKCVACGLVINPESYTIEHIAAEGETPAWHALPQPGAWCSVGISLGRTTTVSRGYKVHVACAKKALPHMDLESLMNPPRPWPRVGQVRGAGT